MPQRSERGCIGDDGDAEGFVGKLSRRLWLAGVLLLALPACAGFALDLADGGDGGGDGSIGSDARTGSVDAAASDGMTVPLAPGEYDADRDGALFAADACFDGADNDDDGFSDCADASCQANVASCCVGTSSERCCPDGVPSVLAFEGCSGDLEPCVDPAEVTVFGSTAPQVRTLAERASLLPGGQTSDSGALLSRTFDPRLGTIRIRAQIASPRTAPDSGSIETVGVGFVDATIDPELISRVAPVAGILVSRNRSEVHLLIAGEVAQSWPLPTEGAIDYTLELDPAGTVTLGAVPLDMTVAAFGGRAAFRTTRPLRVVVYGRTADPDSTDPPSARLLELAVTPRRCDMPGALVRGDATVVPAPLEDPSWAAPYSAIERPHVLRWVDSTGVEVVRMALMIDGEVHLAELGMGGFVLLTPPGEPALVPPSDAWAADGVDHPVLRRVGDELELWFTGFAEGRGTVAIASWDGTRFVTDGPVDDLTATPTRGYAAAVPLDRGGTTLVLVRVDDDVTGQEIQLVSVDAGITTPLGVVHTRSSDLFAFDRDEIGSLAMVEVGGVLRVYYSGRRGTRWSIGILASSDDGHWNEPAGGPILGPSDRGFDSLGARDPAIDIDGEILTVYYAGDDGVRTRIGRAVGAAPPGRSSP